MLQTYTDRRGKTRYLGRPLTWTQPTEVTIGAASTAVVAADATSPRRGIRLWNISDTQFDLSLDGTAALTTDGAPFYAGDFLELLDSDGDDCTKAFYAITHDGSAGKKLRVSTAT